MIKNPEFKDLELSEEQMLKIQGGTRWQVIYRRPDGTSGSETTEDLAGTHARLEGLGFIIVDDVVDGS